METRNKGNVPRSQDLGAVVVLIAGIVSLRMLGGGMWEKMQLLVRTSLGFEGATVPKAEDMAEWAFQAGRIFASLVVPFMIIMFVFAVIIAYLQTGWLFTWEPITPSLGKLNPLNGIKRIFSARSAIKLLIDTGKLLAVSTVVYVTVAQKLDEIMGVILLHEAAMWAQAAGIVFTVTVRILLMMLVLAILDYVYQRYKHEQDLKMTKEEVKEEMRRMEGDPTMKRRRQQVQQQLAIQRIRTAVPQADVVVTNPTEFAVAIKYDSAIMSAPRVVAKGQDYMAVHVRRIAIQYGIPIIERPPLARALYSAVDVGQEIPVEFYKAVAEILAYVYELAGRKPVRAS